MITINEINTISRRYQVSAETIEKDYIISWILSKSEIKDYFIFYGGTALKRMYFEDHRFSEDIDLISDRHFSKEKLIHFLSCMKKLKEEANIEVRVNDDKCQSMRSREIMYLNYEGFDEIIGVPKEIKIDFNMKASSYGESQIIGLIESYSDLKGSSSFLNVMTVETILANKIGMLFDVTRDEPRDIYDIWFLLQKQPQIKLDFKKAFSIIKEKYSFKPTYSMIKARLKMQRHWQTRLQKQINDLPDQNIVIQEILCNLKNLIDAVN